MKKKIIILFAAAIFFSSAAIAFAGSATLNWNANTEPDLAGYKVYYGTSPRSGNCPGGGYASNIDVGNATSRVIGDLPEGHVYYFSLTAYNSAGNESVCSAEVSKVMYHRGDINKSRSVDIFDYNIFIPEFGKTNCGNPADIDGNCLVNIFDYNFLVTDFGKSF